MSIDRLGGKGPLPGAGAPAPAAGAEAPAAPFAVTRGEAPEGAARVDAGALPLERLRRGELDVDGYVEARVDEAVRPLSGLSQDALESIRSELRHRLRSDPALVDLVRAATGAAPKGDE